MSTLPPQAELPSTSAQPSYPDPPYPPLHNSLSGMSGDDNEDQWSAHDTLDTDDQSMGVERRDIEEVEENREEDDLTVVGAKVTSTPKGLTASPPAIDTDVGVGSPTPMMAGPDQVSETASARSLPVVQVTEAPSSPRPSTANCTETVAASSTLMTSATASTTGTQRSVGSQEQRSRYRTNADIRASNRISGFFSNLIHRRDPLPSSGRGSIREEQPSSSGLPTGSDAPSRTESPAPPPARPITPPPSLPPPTLQELGLSLSCVTNNLSPSHFSTPPASGAFLAPHYLLLCHAQGLDVLPLVSPPAPQPYALVRRVSFKSVVVMEHRGVLVAIAGRRDGVRVYALEEVKKAVEWRLEVEVRRERERARREESRRAGPSAFSRGDGKRVSHEKLAKSRMSTSSSTSVSLTTPRAMRKTSSASAASAPVPSSQPSHPVKKRKSSASMAPPEPTSSVPLPNSPPPAYSAVVPEQPRPQRNSLVPAATHDPRARRSSVTDVLTGPILQRALNGGELQLTQNGDVKGDWVDGRNSSDDEAINIVAAGASGSQALDERTSTGQRPLTSPISSPARVGIAPLPPAPGRALTSQAVLTSPTLRRSRPSNLDLSAMRANTTAGVPPPQPSPTPTLMSLQQALHAPSGPSNNPPQAPTVDTPEPTSPDGDDDDDGAGMSGPAPSRVTPRDEITLAEALMESRLPELPPVGSRRPQQPILITSSHPVVTGEDEPSSPRTSEAHTVRPLVHDQSTRRRRRWSVLEGIFNGPEPPTQEVPAPDSEPSSPTVAAPPPPPLAMAERRPSQLTRSQSFRSQALSGSSSHARPLPATRPSSSPGGNVARLPLTPPSGNPEMSGSPVRPHSRFIPRILQDAFTSRRSDEPTTFAGRIADADAKKTATNNTAPHAPAPKLEYVKLPGTKGALMIKAVETAKKSFLAILCGENGEKVELFAGTYRTALGLSRTFILPDSPRSLELQLQGDDLVEVFLVFSQNVFGLEPATVRVREVRIGRAERRAARRRARENRVEEAPAADADATPAAEDDTNVNVSIGVPVSSSNVSANGNAAPTNTESSPFGPPPPPEGSQTPAEIPSSTTSTSTEELLALATAHMGPYTTFQQLSFSPNFPLASIADEYTIPPTYPSFIEYRSDHESDGSGNHTVDLTQVNFSPPGLPLPTPAPPSKWYYRDPKGVVHGPWKASLMQAWYKDGLLPPDLPVKREEDSIFTLLRDLRLQCVDPTHPFRSAPPPMATQPAPIPHEPGKPLLSPISLLSQPKHFGPPALFYSSRGGHSTAIVDARGRSVLKGRFVWSADDDDDSGSITGKMGDVKRLEAFDVQDRAVLVAMRQGGLEAVDFGDALLKPADTSRTILPHFHPPLSNVNRRGPFIWRIGTPISSGPSALSTSTSMKRTAAFTPTKKLSTGPGRSPGKTDFSFSPDSPQDQVQDEVLFLGRKNDEMYICERRAGSFRILRLGPTPLNS